MTSMRPLITTLTGFYSQFSYFLSYFLSYFRSQPCAAIRAPVLWFSLDQMGLVLVLLTQPG